MQMIKIVIGSGKLQSVEVMDGNKPKAVREIRMLLRSMPKELLVDSIGKSRLTAKNGMRPD